jgi:hypothetical protein
MIGKKKDAPPARAPESDHVNVDEGARGQGGEGTRNAETTPKIAPLKSPGQTSHPAPADDVGVPPDDELGRQS